MGVGKLDKIAAGILKYFSKHQPHDRGEAYEFSIKMRPVGIPKEVRERLPEKVIDNIYEAEAQFRIDVFMEELIEKFPWIVTWRTAGRSGGWLVIEPEFAVLDEHGNVDLDSAPGSRGPKDWFPGGSSAHAEKRLDDLAEIGRLVGAAKRDLKMDLESVAWWDEY